MDSKKVYQSLEEDFIKFGLTDDWAQHMEVIDEFLSENFKKRSMGLVCDFATEINKVFSAVFPSKKVMQQILDSGLTDAMLFVHHPSIWDITKAPTVFQQMDKDFLLQFRKKRISIYNLHVPLDNFGEYSTSGTLANALDIKIEKPFAPYFGALCGVFGKTDLIKVEDLKNKFQEVVGHNVSLYAYGDSEIKNGNVAVIVGGGNDLEMLKEIAKDGVNTFVTGITAKSEHSKEAHDFAEKNKINILGGTHYSTETFACIAMIKYFEKLGLPSEFIRDVPGMEDL